MEIDLRPDPIDQFAVWFREAQSVTSKYPEAMTLATVDSQNRPSCRVVLFKGFSEGGFTFFTNYESRKGKEIAVNPYAAATFYWPVLDRQVRIEGSLEKLSPEESFDYFKTRPRDSRISAWASPQSREIPDRRFLEDRIAEMEKRFLNQDVPLPTFWGGYRLNPDKIEFWLELPNRRHDRFLYHRNGPIWRITRLSP